MNSRKTFAMLAVLVMVTGCMTCVMATTDNDASVTLKDKGTVYLDASKDFEGNKENLEKLGITDSSRWVYDPVNYSTSLILKDVHYATESNHAIVVYGSCYFFNIVVSGDNSITFGVTREYSEIKYTTGIYAYDTIQCVRIAGDGKLTIGCSDGLATDYGGSALYVSKHLLVDGCTLIAKGPTVKHLIKGAGDYSSNGIVTESGSMIVNDATIIATGGDVYSNGECIVDGVKQCTKSAGICVGEYSTTAAFLGENSVVYAKGGDVESDAPGFMTQEGSSKIDVDSVGFYVAGKMSFENCVIRGYGGKAVSLKVESILMHVSSEGIRFNANLDAKNSVIFAVGGETASSELAVSAGIRHFEALGVGYAKKIDFNLTGCNLFAYGYISEGGSIGRGTYGGSFGLFASEVGDNATNFELAITLTDSVALFKSFDARVNHNSVAVRILENTPTEKGEANPEARGSIAVNNSEMYLHGFTKAIIAQKVTTGGSDLKFSLASESGTLMDMQEVDVQYFPTGSYKFCTVGYKFDLFAMTNYSIESPIKVYRYDSLKVTLPQYELKYYPDGEDFKCWSFNGKEYKPGDVIDLREGVVVTAAFGKTATNDNTPWIILVIVIALVVLVLIALYAYYSSKKSEETPRSGAARKTAAAKRGKPKSATVKKATAKKTTARKTTAKKTATKRAAKPRSKE